MSSLTHNRRPARKAVRIYGAAMLAAIVLAGCDENGKFSLPLPQGNANASTAGTTKSTKLVERDVEAPEVFSVTDQGLWDGRPSLGGVWVAHPDVSDPERVIIRNEANGKFVIGALFRKERDLPGPKLQMSSDAAAALSVLAGAPAPLNVTALRREETAEPAEVEVSEAETVAAAPAVTETSLDPIAAAGAAIETAPANATAAAAASAPKPAAPRPTSSLAKPFVQLGIFSVEANANRVAKQMRGAGMIPSVKQSQINGKPFWRVVVGPASSKSELNNLLKAIKAEGFSDAYAVSN
ncbi:Lipoprotein [Sulfitobacter noctilucicola]|uniref:Cell division septation protein DedD n=1 Tax=Sulfitobacter noctilucicola TaxID=1342301 RepID=A0A7W6MAN7_9RHOB|nr:SPOR domain-containing protein [Sulfitobacter noctilucicola]KIN64180.1 Lipoprotein [Sulfitobacter noctilucicola]MBB4175534.1 cell division septation protein DedD [Sulfitobacter noctilucicola]